jgi:cytochrome d ubiquinol oxidase subunit II
MGYATLWLFGFGVLFAGYLVLAGFDYGVGILLPYAAKTEGERRLALNAFGPFFLGNEVWLLVAIGTMIGTLPGLESRLLSGTYPLAIVAVAGAIVLNVSVQLRSRQESPRLRGFWDALVCAGGVAAAFGWGAVLTAVAGGIELGKDGHVTGSAGSFTVFSVLGGISTVFLLSTHGAIFLTARTYGAVAVRAKRATPILSVLSSLLVVTTVITGRTGDYLIGAFRQPALALLLLLIALVALKFALWRVTRGKAWQAFAAMALAVGLMPLMVFAGKYPTLITSAHPGIPAPSVEDLAGSGPSLALITWTAGPVLLLVIAVQVVGWWAFRGRMTRQSPIFY